MPTISRRTALSAIAAGTSAVLWRRRLNAADLGPPGESSWPSFRRTPDQRGVAATTLSADPQLQWEFPSKDGWVGTSAIVGDHVYAPALEGKIYCLDRLTGDVVWQYRSIESDDPKEFAPGFKAAPLVTSAAVYVGDEDGILHALDRASGKRLWVFETGAEIAGGVARWNDRLIVASHDSSLYCLSTDGEQIWDYQTNDRINCSPAIVDHFTFVSGCDSKLRVIDIEAGEQVLDVDTEDYLIASPAIVGDMLYVGSHGGDVTATNWKTGEILWRYTADRQLSIRASAVATDDLIIVGGHDKLMHAIDRLTGAAVWVFATKGRIECSAAVVDQRLFFGSADRNLYGLFTSDGTEVWKYNAGQPINGGVAIGEQCMVVGEDAADGRLLCFS